MTGSAGGAGNSNPNISLHQLGSLHDIKEEKGKLTGKFTTSDGRTFDVEAKYDENVLGKGSDVAKKIEAFFQNFESKELKALSGYTMTSSKEGFQILKEGNIAKNPEAPPELKSAKEKAEKSFKEVFQGQPGKTEKSLQKGHIGKTESKASLSLEEVKREGIEKKTQERSELEKKPRLERQEGGIFSPGKAGLARGAALPKGTSASEFFDRQYLSSGKQKSTPPTAQTSADKTQGPVRDAKAEEKAAEKKENGPEIKAGENKKEVPIKPRSEGKPPLTKQKREIFKGFSPDFSDFSSVSSAREKSAPPPPTQTPLSKAQEFCSKFASADEKGKAQIREEVGKLVEECLKSKKFDEARACRNELGKVSPAEDGFVSGLEKKIRYEQVLNEIYTTEKSYRTDLKKLYDLTQLNEGSKAQALKHLLGTEYAKFKESVGFLYENSKYLEDLLSDPKEKAAQSFAQWDAFPQRGQLVGAFKEFARIYNMQMKQKMASKDSKDEKALRVLDKMPMFEGTGFAGHLILPIQRGPRYVLLAKELEKASDSPENPFVKKFSKFANEEIATPMNEYSAKFMLESYALSARKDWGNGKYEAGFNSYLAAFGEAKGKDKEELRNEIFGNIEKLAEKGKAKAAKKYLEALKKADPDVVNNEVALKYTKLNQLFSK